jgi:hypothetical protein
MLSNALWQAQTTLHGKNNNVVIPAMLVATASILVVYKHFADEHGGDPIKHFLGLVVIQMMPLIFLQMKILSCPDPVSMLTRFGAKTLLMHICFLALRVCAWPLLEVGLGFCNLVGLVVACAALHWGFNFSCNSLRAHSDVCGLWLLAVAGALCTELLDFHRQVSLLESTIFTASNYIELLAFVPAVWMVQQAVKKNDDTYVAGADSKVQSQAVFFFAFLVLYYVMEDVISAFRVGGDAPLAAIGHIVHFLLLLDFACFLLAKIYNPDQVHGSFLRRIPDQFWV